MPKTQHYESYQKEAINCCTLKPEILLCQAKKMNVESLRTSKGDDKGESQEMKIAKVSRKFFKSLIYREGRFLYIESFHPLFKLISAFHDFHINVLIFSIFL